MIEIEATLFIGCTVERGFEVKHDRSFFFFVPGQDIERDLNF